MNKFLNNWAQGSDNPFNFLAFSVNKIQEIFPHIDEWYAYFLGLWGSYDGELKMIFLLASVILAGLLVYIAFKAVGSMRDNRKIHPHHLIGFGGDEE